MALAYNLSLPCFLSWPGEEPAIFSLAAMTNSNNFHDNMADRQLEGSQQAQRQIDKAYSWSPFQLGFLMACSTVWNYSHDPWRHSFPQTASGFCSKLAQILNIDCHYRTQTSKMAAIQAKWAKCCVSQYMQYECIHIFLPYVTFFVLLAVLQSALMPNLIAFSQESRVSSFSRLQFCNLCIKICGYTSRITGC